ncbi:hypothetical protein RJT34_32185 [Clitoria ternatea]|uniref:Uncharacterized protein n=1 Tax=Clitoria ternatea TaxID=43366 RepID=A0AAN9EWG4_CLITE
MNSTRDVSPSLLLIEDSADSEEDSATPVGNNSEDDDDAESTCNCDTANMVEGDETHQDDKLRCGDEDGGNSTMWMSVEPLEEVEEAERRVGEVKVNVNQLEDRLFWETCMAVGYP